jgi:hypothetical protein
MTWKKSLLAGMAISATAALAAVPALAQPQTIVSCTTAGMSTADPVTHGFYVQNYPADALSDVTLTYYATKTGVYTIALSVGIDAFDGTHVATRVKTGNIQTANVPVAVTFQFEGVPVAHGQTLMFEQSVLGPGEDSLLFDTGMGTCAATETKDFTPPTSTVTRNSVGVTITAPPANACVPAGTTLCLSDVEGDNRFQAIATYKTSQSGGLAGSANVVDTTDLGVSQGGILWFFSQANPEMLLKVINGCAVNNFYWVFFAADTNVGFTVTVTDTAQGRTKTYTNPDLTAAVPIQDTAAFPCS